MAWREAWRAQTSSRFRLTRAVSPFPLALPLAVSRTQAVAGTSAAHGLLVVSAWQRRLVAATAVATVAATGTVWLGAAMRVVGVRERSGKRVVGVREGRGKRNGGREKRAAMEANRRTTNRGRRARKGQRR